MSHAVKAALLSGLVFPGLGQLVLKQYRRGLAFLIAAIACIAVIVTMATRQAMTAMANMDPATLADPNALADAANQVAADSAGLPYSLATMALAVCWVWSVVDAWLSGRVLDKNNRPDD